MKLLKIQIEAIARRIHNEILDRMKTNFNPKRKVKMEAHIQSLKELDEKRKALDAQRDAVCKAFEKEYGVHYWGNDTSEVIIDRIVNKEVPSISLIEGEICIQAAFSKNEDAEAFAKRVTDILEKKK